MVRLKNFQPAGWLTVILLLLCLLSAAWIFQYQYPYGKVHNQTEALAAFIYFHSTLPRMVIACLAGGALGLASLLLQQIMRNPIASDSTLGVTAGAQMALIITTVFAPSLLQWGNVVVTFAGALISILIVLYLSRKKQCDVLIVVLAGMVLSLYLGAISSVLLLFNSEELTGSLLWSAGILVQDSWHDTLFLMLCLLIGLPVLLILLRPLNILMLSDEQANTLGLPVQWIRLFALLLAAWFSATVVSLVGMMGFIGLAAASLVNQLNIRTLTMRFIMVFVLGALLLCLTDNILSLFGILLHIDIPTGAATALIGAPLLLFLMFRFKKTQYRPVQSVFIPHKPLPYHNEIVWLLLILVLFLSLSVSQSANGWQFSLQPELLNMRWPRVIGAAATGVLLASAGVLLQRLTQNPMASPELLGISSSVALGVLTAVLLLGITAGSMAFWIVGIIAALVALIVIMLLNYRSHLSSDKLILMGIALAALTDAFIRFWNASGDFRVLQMLIWLSGSTYNMDAHLAIMLIFMAALLFLTCLFTVRWLSLLGLNTTIAQAVGLNLTFARICLIILVSLMTAIATLAIGPLSFIGLLAPHMARILGGRLPQQQLCLAAVLGTVLMIMADWLGRQLLFPYEIPTGLMATLIGGAYFLVLMRRL